MKRFLGLALGVFLVIVFISSAEAITITLAEVQNGVAVVQGNKADKSAIITWDGISVTQTTKGGSFSFSGTVPADCVGTLSDGVSTIEVVVLDCTPVSVAPAPVPKTGQVTCYDSLGVIIDCSGTGQDGALQKGVNITPRFTDNANGTFTDNLTGLIWVKNAHCFVGQSWDQALSDANGLHSGECGLTDGSVAGDWRLPNLKELLSLVDYGVRFPALSNSAGTGQATDNDPFTGLFLGIGYYSSTTYLPAPTIVWSVQFDEGRTDFALKTSNAGVLFVRGP